MISADELISELNSGFFFELIINMLVFFYPEKLENYSIDTSTIYNCETFCLNLLDKNYSISGRLRIYISKRHNRITFKRYNFPEGNKIIDKHIPLEEINNIDDFYLTLYENIIITD